MMEHKNKYTKNQILIVQAHAQTARTPFLSYFPPFSPLPYTLSLPKQTFISIFSFLFSFFLSSLPQTRHTPQYIFIPQMSLLQHQVVHKIFGITITITNGDQPLH